ncbi:hypothetical protein DL93DRAFT_2205857 [Clavulina sp. PMI_390]|nr:hypothetical protein DL93DRAFT_2205857 [Clavulina sp. PMI_390]
MSAPRQYDYGKPEETLSEWTSKVRNLQGLVDQDDAEERERLEREIEQSRLERARRRGKSIDIGSSPPSAPSPISSTSPPPIISSSTNTSTSSERASPMSLAAFIGGKATGPRLTRRLHPDDPIDPEDLNPKPYANRVSPLAQVARGQGGPAHMESSRPFALPGMRPETDEKRSSTLPPPKVASPSTKEPVGNPKAASVPALSATTSSPAVQSPTPSPKPSSSTFLSVAERTKQLADARSSQSPSPSPLASSPPVATPSAAPIPGPKPSLPFNKPAAPPPSASARASPSSSAEASAKVLTPSLTRLQGRGLVGERVKAAEIFSTEPPLQEEPEPMSSPSPVVPPARSVSDSARETNPIASPGGFEGRPRKKSVLDRWPPSGSPVSEKFSESPKDTGPPTSTPVLKSAKSFERPKPVTLDPPKNAPVSSPSPAPSSPFGSRWNSSASEVRTTSPAPSAARPNVGGPASAPKPSAEPDNTTPLTHLTRDRAKKPKRGGSSLARIASEDADADENPVPPLSSSKLSEPPKFNTTLKGDTTSTTPTVASRAATLTSSASPAPTRSQVLSPPPTAPPLRESSPVTSTARGESVSKLMDTWGSRAPIGVKTPTPGSKPTPGGETVPSRSGTSSPYAATRRALPGMAKTPEPTTPSSASSPRSVEPPKPLTPTSVSSPMRQSQQPLQPPARPSAMDMAQALNLVDAPASSPATSSLAAPAPAAVVPESSSPTLNRTPSRRRSSFSPAANALPSVAEVDTPPPSLTREVGRTLAASSNAQAVKAPIASGPKTFKHDDKPLPRVDVAALLAEAAKPPPLSFDPTFKPISTDVMSIRGRSASPVTVQPHIFYDSELRAIVYRSKDLSSGLASTTIWTWTGKNATVGPDETWKIKDLESRFGTKVVPCEQGKEPLELISLLGGVIAVRQGSVGLWSVENTAMHCVRSAPHGSNVIITELDLNIQNLSSAYSYVLSVPGSIYVWHGRGSRPNERSHASSYASTLSQDSLPVADFEEGDEDSMFWAYLGDEPWANADYWSERSQHEGRPSSVAWKVDGSAAPAKSCQRIDLPDTGRSPNGVYVVDGIFEVFVIVGVDARGDRSSIRLALDIAKGISAHNAASRPFSPPIHIVVLPSQLPADLRVGHLGVIDETTLNAGSIPEHMNVLQIDDALAQLAKTSWGPENLKDPSFLPLGVSPAML